MGRLAFPEGTDLPTSIGREQDIAMSYDPSTTAILLVDPYNDFLSECGKLWARVKAVAEEVKLLDHLREVVSIARARGLKIFFVPHHRSEPGDYVAFDNPSPYQLAGPNAQIFAMASTRHC